MVVVVWVAAGGRGLVMVVGRGFCCGGKGSGC